MRGGRRRLKEFYERALRASGLERTLDLYAERLGVPVRHLRPAERFMPARKVGRLNRTAKPIDGRDCAPAASWTSVHFGLLHR